MAYCPGMWTDVKTFIKHCAVFQSLKADNQKPAGKMQQPTVIGQNVSQLGCDAGDPSTSSPFLYLCFLCLSCGYVCVCVCVWVLVCVVCPRSLSPSSVEAAIGGPHRNQTRTA